MDARATKKRLIIMAGALLVLTLSWIYAPWAAMGPVLCPLRSLTGLSCPGCGLTRSFCAAAHGDFTASLDFHPLGPVLFLATLAVIPLLLFEVIRKRRIESVHQTLFSSRGAWVGASVLVAIQLIRLVSKVA